MADDSRSSAPSLRQRLLVPWVVMPAVALVALAGWWSFLRSDYGGSTSVTATAAATEQLVAASTGTMAQTVSAQGTVAAAQTDDLSFSSSGTVTAVNVAAGDEVTVGQVLATIDSAELEAAVEEAEANLADAEATLADDTDADASDEQIEVDAAAVTSAQDALDSAQEALDGAQLVASFAGAVTSVDLTVGEELGSGGVGGTTQTGTSSGSGQSAGTLGDGSTSPAAGGGAETSSSAQIQVLSAGSFTVELALDATEVADVAVGQLAEVALGTASSSTTGGFGGFPGGGFPGAGNFGGGATTTTTEADDTGAGATEAPAATSADSVTGLVTEVAAVADASSGVATYAVTVAFMDDSGTYQVGATVDVDITYAEVEGAVQVPVRAVTTSGTTSTVTVSTDGKQESRTVQTGLTADGMVQITSGLEAGEQVVITLPGRPGATGTGEAPSGLQLPGGSAPDQANGEGG